jgi:dTDP-4-dehydrorhamnose 3,5-epimerase
VRIQATTIPDVVVIEPDVFEDDRGFFIETYHAARFAAAGFADRFVQDNHAGSRRGVLRGLHYQVRHSQGKLIRAVAGEVFDVAVDLRRRSPTFGRWAGTLLSAANRLQIWIPPGFAHGYYALSDWAEVTYKATDFYTPQWERTLLWNDPAVGIDWPLLRGLAPIVSAKDRRGTPFAQADYFD